MVQSYTLGFDMQLLVVERGCTVSTDAASATGLAKMITLEVAHASEGKLERISLLLKAYTKETVSEYQR